MSPSSKITSSTFRRWLGSRFCSNYAKQMADLVVAWQVYQLSKDPLALGLIGLSYAIPFISISLWAGHMVDRHEKKMFMMMSEAGLILAIGCLFAITFLPKPPLLLIYINVGMIGLFSSFENISASAYAQTYIPKEEFPKAAGWNLALFQTAIITGPLSGGAIVQHFNPRMAYGVSVLFLLVSFLLAAGLEKMPPLPEKSDEKTGRPESDWARVKSGIRFIRSQPLILASMSIDLAVVLFADCVALFPIFADRFHAGATGLGFLRAAPSIGSLLVSSTQLIRPFVDVSWRNLKRVVMIFGVAMIAFALSPNLLVAALFLVCSGAADGMSVIIRQSIYQALTPDHLRGRVASVSLIFISSSNEIGAFESGVAARLIGVVPSVVFGGLMTFGSVFIMNRIFRDLNRNERRTG